MAKGELHEPARLPGQHGLGDLDEDGTLVLTRTVSSEGRSRAFAGGRSVPVSLLTYLADDLVAVHGQADQQQLLKPGRQRQALDRFSGPEFAGLLASYQRAYHRHQQVSAELAELTTMARDRAREADDLRRGVEEIERAEPVEGEDIELVAEEERLANADALHAAATAAHEALAGDPSSGSYDAADVTSLLAAARTALEGAAQHDAQLAALAGFRDDLREFNLYDTEAPENGDGSVVSRAWRRISPRRGPGAPRRPDPADQGVRRGDGGRSGRR